MRWLLAVVLGLGALGEPGSVEAQRVIAQDTLSAATPAAVTCGFCAGERYGVVFRELEPTGGLQPEDFPLTLRSLRIAVASARVTGGAGAFTCEGLTAAGSALADLELWAGSEVPTGSLSELPMDGAWNASEELVWAAVDVPLMLSTAETDGSSMIEAGFNELQPVDELEQPIVLDDATRYVRAVVLIREGTAGSSASCDAVAQDPPSLFPLRDDDGVIANERGFIYASGAGWLWNEAASIGGDWAIRLEVRSEASPGDDMGPIDTDAGPGTMSDGGPAAADDAAAPDLDAGVVAAGGGGCDCHTTGGTAAWWPLALALAWLRRR